MQFIQIALLFLGLIFTSESLAQDRGGSESRVITKDRFNKVVKVLLDTVKRQKELEEQVIIMQDKLRAARMSGGGEAGPNVGAPGMSPEVPSSDDSSVDLSALDSGGADAVASGGGRPAASHSAGKGMGQPHLNVYFDFWLISQPSAGFNQGDGFTFATIHNFFLLEVVANADLKFSAELSTAPRYYEMDYQLTRWLQLRLGKIWIPFDDLQPHNMFGGRMNVSRFSSSSAQTESALFLPMIWADLGVGLKFTILDREKLALEGHLYAVNGFTGGGVDPINSSTRYPSFSGGTASSTVSDNNREKSFGTRLHALFAQTFGLGISAYEGRWTNKDDEKKGLGIYGMDAQLYLGRFETRAGLASMKIDLPRANGGSDFGRFGHYVETSYKLGEKRHWKVVGSFGSVNSDDRVVDINDKQIYLGKILYRPNNIEWSIQHSRDVKVVAAKGNKSITGFRVVMMF